MFGFIQEACSIGKYFDRFLHRIYEKYQTFGKSLDVNLYMPHTL